MEDFRNYHYGDGSVLQAPVSLQGITRVQSPVTERLMVYSSQILSSCHCYVNTVTGCTSIISCSRSGNFLVLSQVLDLLIMFSFSVCRNRVLYPH